MESPLLFEIDALSEITNQFRNKSNCLLDVSKLTGIVPFRDIHSVSALSVNHQLEAKYQLCLLRLNDNQTVFFSKLEENLDTKLIGHIPNFCDKELSISVLPVRIRDTNQLTNIFPESDSTVNQTAKIQFHISKLAGDKTKITPYFEEITTLAQSSTNQRKPIPFGRKLPARD